VIVNVLAVIAGFATVLIPYVVLVRRTDAALVQEQARVNDLLLLLESKAAPSEVAAFLRPPAEEPRQVFLHSEDGLVSVPYSEDDDG
jgi:hypothetical protein